MLILYALNVYLGYTLWFSLQICLLGANVLLHSIHFQPESSYKNRISITLYFCLHGPCETTAHWLAEPPHVTIITAMYSVFKNIVRLLCKCIASYIEKYYLTVPYPASMNIVVICLVSKGYWYQKCTGVCLWILKNGFMMWRKPYYNFKGMFKDWLTLLY